MKAPASMKPSTAMEAAAEARLAASGKFSRHSSVIESTERTGMGARESMLRLAETSRARGTAAVESASAMKSASAIEVVAIDEDSAV